MQNGVLDSADVLVDGEPVLRLRRIKRSLHVLRVRVAIEVPTGINEGVHGVGFAFGWLAAFGAGDVDELRHAAQRRAALLGDFNLIGQHDGQLVVGNRHKAAALAVNDGDGRAPETLPAHAPVLEAEGDLGLAEGTACSSLLEEFLRASTTQAVVLAGVDEYAVFGTEREALRALGALDWLNHLDNGQVVFCGELEVALIVAGNAHDSAGAVVGKDVVGHPDGHTLVVVGVDGKTACGNAVLFDCAQVAGLARFLLLGDHGVDLLFELRVGGGELPGEFVLWGQLHTGGAEDGVHAGGENADARLFYSLFPVPCSLVDFFRQEKVDVRSFAAADPVALHGANFFRPAFQLVEAVEQLLGVGGDAKEPLHQIALVHLRGFVPPAASIDDLLVGQNSGALRAPIDLAFFAVNQAFFVHAQEEPLVPSVVLRQAGGDFARPVVAQAEPVHLDFHRGDVGEGPLARRGVVFERGVFGGQAEGVPAHGMEHVVAAHPHMAGQRVADGVVAHVAHVQLAAGIGQHFQHVVLGLAAGCGLGRIERGVRSPALLPFGFNRCRVVTLFVLFRHNTSSVNGGGIYCGGGGGGTGMGAVVGSVPSSAGQSEPGASLFTIS